MKREPMFSVVIPAYNAERFILDALDSVESQTLRADEIIVVDDGSRDATVALVEDWRRQPASRLRLHRQDNQGAGAARNAGVGLASGEFVAFLDADDTWMSNKLEVVAGYLERHPEADVACHDEWLRQGGARSRVLRHGPRARYEDLLFRGNCLSPSATVVRRKKLLEAGGFSTNLDYDGAEDYELWLRLAGAGCVFGFVRQPLGVYNAHGAGISSSVDRLCRHILNVLAHHFESWQPQNTYYIYQMRRRRAMTLRWAGHEWMLRNDHTRASQFLIPALREDPFAWKTWLLSVANLAGLRL
ncbi:MAG: glycosyltransferase [Acidobacteria bacterium]|nr:glycosyltransferase [Acidobacteriota bacterium]